MKNIVKKLKINHNLTDSEFIKLIKNSKYDKELFKEADAIRRENYENHVYIRGLIEFTSYCKQNCYYCGLRRDNKNANRYRLTKKEILSCCEEGYKLGFRTFVLQGGDDDGFSDNDICEIVKKIKASFPDCAVTLSIGERDYEVYKSFKLAGADRYLLRHETADNEHYSMLHPKSSTALKRQKCLFDLKELGFQVGSGFMVGSPFQTTEHIVKDLRFLQKLQPDMIGIGPYIPHCDTPFFDKTAGTLSLTLRMISILRLMFPKALIPATTALGTIKKGGRELGLSVGANVVMPNLSPINVRKKYAIYENKICTDDESAEGLASLKESVKKTGYEIVTDIGHAKSYLKE